MRNLTIKRGKSFVGCLAGAQVYVEAPTAKEVINGVHCQKLGKLKNGEEKTFQISDNAAKLFVIADKLSKNYCNDCYQIPEGEEDIILSGKYEFNPLIGNAFRFEGEPSEETLENRTKSRRKGVIVLGISIGIGVLVGLAISFGIFISLMSSGKGSSKPKTFAGEEMTITLTDEFRETEYEGFYACYDSSKVAVFAIKDDFSLLEGLEDYTLMEYASLVAQGSGKDASDLKKLDDLVYFDYEYENTEYHEEYEYYVFLYKEKDAFWIIQFAVNDEYEDEYARKIFEWAGSVEFTE